MPLSKKSENVKRTPRFFLSGWKNLGDNLVLFLRKWKHLEWCWWTFFFGGERILEDPQVSFWRMWKNLEAPCVFCLKQYENVLRSLSVLFGKNVKEYLGGLWCLFLKKGKHLGRHWSLFLKQHEKILETPSGLLKEREWILRVKELLKPPVTF